VGLLNEPGIAGQATSYETVIATTSTPKWGARRHTGKTKIWWTLPRCGGQTAGEMDVAGKSGNGIVYVALVFSALAAVMSAQADSSGTYRTLSWLLMQQSAPETMATAAAIGEPITFPVSP
jgi:hypothetical protein